MLASLLIVFIAMASYTAYLFLPARMYDLWKLMQYISGIHLPDEAVTDLPGSEQEFS